ncbi:RNA-binding protein [Streptococcus suis]|uniref:YlmH family RNA-binding protein n=2 Tax=Streptococcus suis TaxID=1307 RepID=UPI0004194FF0|nr:YlmH/Sll1252 family protein [Streptococcus suis]MBO4131260.1 RNA-binding protein [Streptococcus suis]MBO4132772.1 RNA-binding protein [Streptococcus suis]NQK11563.1 RNA-binding protein [Streptococcus suis]QSQ91413.1 RNA-binding protein [Streptococcus suis]HEM3554030.1 RNA-binding protein [Streptococcus suis]
MKNDKNLLQHFSREEREFVEKIMDMCQQVEDTYSYRLTQFLHPRQDEIVCKIANYYQLQTFSSRDLISTEHSRVIIAPAYYELDIKDFELTALHLSYARKFHTLSHSQVLGTFLNQLGIKREYLGDVLIDDERLIVFIDQKFGQIALQSITKVARVPVKGKEEEWTTVRLPIGQEWRSKDVLVSSMRLDKLISVAFNLSRATANKLIEAGHVKLDYVLTEQTSKLVEIGQLISVRRYGRVRLNEFLGFSKQGKIKLKLDIVKT